MTKRSVRSIVPPARARSLHLMKATATRSPSGELTEYAEILKLAYEEGLRSISTELLVTPSEDNGNRCIIKAVVEVERGRFEGIGDADPDNVEPGLAPHLIRVAETRAKARALRDAVNTGVDSLEEEDGVSLTRANGLGSGAPASKSSRPARNGTSTTRPRGNGSLPTQSNLTAGEPMSPAQRRYLFRIMADQGYKREAAEERLKDIFEVPTLTGITKIGAMKMIDALLRNGASTRGANGAERHARR